MCLVARSLLLSRPLTIILWLLCVVVGEFDPGGEQTLFSDNSLSSNFHNSSSDQLMRFGRFGNSYIITEFADNSRLGRSRLNRRRYFDSTCELFPDHFYHKFFFSKRRRSSFFSSKRVL